MKRLTVFASVLALVGCSHSMSLIDQETGATYKTSVPASWGYSGKASIDVDGETFAGEWVLTPQGGTAGVGTAFGSDGSVATGVFAGVPLSGNGSMILTSESGNMIRCGFDYSEWSATGIGKCQDKSGQIYDLHIK